MTAATSAPLDGYVPPEIVSTVFHSATVSDNLAILVAETVGGVPRLSWGNQGAVALLGYAIEDETDEQVQALSDLGATYLQGFSLARPMTGPAAATFFATRQGEPIR